MEIFQANVEHKTLKQFYEKNIFVNIGNYIRGAYGRTEIAVHQRFDIQAI
jgi:hypothetical protein